MIFHDFCYLPSELCYNFEGKTGIYRGFLKWWVSPTTMGVFLLKNNHFGMFWGYHHLRKHPYSTRNIPPDRSIFTSELALKKWGDSLDSFIPPAKSETPLLILRSLNELSLRNWVGAPSPNYIASSFTNLDFPDIRGSHFHSKKLAFWGAKSVVFEVAPAPIRWMSSSHPGQDSEARTGPQK